MLDKGDENEILVEDVSNSYRDVPKKLDESSNSVNRQDIAIDQFLDENTQSNIDSQIRKDMMKTSRYSYMGGNHGLTTT